MIKKLAALPLIVAVCLLAADFWDSKPYTEWSEKEVDKILTNSPWADEIGVRTGQKGVIATADDGKGPIMGELEVQVKMIWMTSLPVKQALVKRGAAQAAMLERQEQFHVLMLSGLPFSASAAASPDNLAALTEVTALNVKGKSPIRPMEIQRPAPAAGKGAPKAAPGPIAAEEPAAAPAGKGGRGGAGFSIPNVGGGGKGFGGANFDLYFLFPKSANITEADKEVEFSTKLGNLTIRKKFKLADMVFNGKLEM